MTPDEFAAEAHAAVDRFVERCKQAADKTPAEWPFDEMGAGEWWEQFMSDEDNE